MTSRSTLLSFAGLALVVATTACAEKITEGNTETDYAALWRQSDPNAANAKKPVLTVTASDGKAAVFLHGGPPSAPGTFQSIARNGSGFPAGVSMVSRTMAVRPDGSRFNVGTGIGEIPADGTISGVFATSCPSGYVEFYEVVIAGGVTTESNHVAPTC